MLHPYTDFMAADEQFEKYIINLLVGENLGQICVGSFDRFEFGPNRPISYVEKYPEYDSRDGIRGILKDNWYYYIHIAI